MLPSLLAVALVFSDVGGTYSWVRWADGDYGLYQGDTQVGYLSPKGNYYPRLGPGSFGAKADPPIPAPYATGGVAVEKLSATPRYSTATGDVTADEAKRMIQDSRIPTPAGKLAVTVIGPDATRAKVLADLNGSPLFAEVRRDIVVRDYDPTHWHVAAAGFVTGGSPTIYVQTADGTVLHRQDTYDGPESLLEALRRASPNYDPKRDSNLAKLGLRWLGLPDMSKVPPVAWAGGALLLVAVLGRIARKKRA